VKPLSEFSLVFIHLLWSSKANAALVCIRTASSGAFPDEVALELRELQFSAIYEFCERIPVLFTDE
jgi:hypothetical protein